MDPTPALALGDVGLSVASDVPTPKLPGYVTQTVSELAGGGGGMCNAQSEKL